MAEETTELELPKGFSRQLLERSLSPRHQELILLPTEKCNFRCTYCYEDFVILLRWGSLTRPQMGEFEVAIGGHWQDVPKTAKSNRTANRAAC